MRKEVKIGWCGKVVWMSEPRPTKRTRRTIFKWELINSTHVLITDDMPVYRGWCMTQEEFARLINLGEFKYYLGKESERWRR